MGSCERDAIALTSARRSGSYFSGGLFEPGNQLSGHPSAVFHLDALR